MNWNRFDALDPQSAATLRARERLLDVVRAIHSLDPGALAQPFADGGGQVLDGFRAVLELHESAPDASDRLADLIMTFDPGIEQRLEALARARPAQYARSIRAVIESRGYRRVHTAALGTGALMMWHFSDTDTERHWRHGIATGVLAMLALGPDHPDRDRVFAAGLMHDIGRLALTRTPAPAADTARPAPDQAFVFDAAGSIVVRALGLPDWLQTAVRPCELSPEHEGALNTVTATACIVATALGYPQSGPAASVPRVEALRAVRSALEGHGGEPWLAERVESMMIAARGDLAAVLSVA